MLESQAGRFLCAEPDGTVVADRAVLSTWVYIGLWCGLVEVCVC